MTLHKAPYKRVKLTPQEQRLWEDTLAALSWIAPGFIHIIFTMMANSRHKDIALFTDDIETTAATDGFQLIFKPKAFFKYDLMERCFIVLHEVMHEILNHVRLGYAFLVRREITLNGKSLPYNHDFANQIQDYIINAILVASKLGKFNTDWLLDPAIATDQDQWIETYFRHAKVKPAQKGQRFDEHLPPGESTGTPAEEMPERNEQQWQIVTKQAMEIQAAHGKMPDALKLFFEELLRPRVDWTDHIRGLITRIAGSGAYDWRRLDRRLIVRGIGAPGMSGHGAGLVVVAYDTSGSVFQDPTLIARFRGETGGMLEDVKPELIKVIECDTEIKKVTDLEDPTDMKKLDVIQGGGGTDFQPVFKYIEDEDLRPDVLIYLTDGYGSFPKHEPDYPVIWGCISDGSVTYPFGTRVNIPVADPDD